MREDAQVTVQPNLIEDKILVEIYNGSAQSPHQALLPVEKAVALRNQLSRVIERARRAQNLATK